MTTGRRMTAEEIARVCHNANRAYCESLGDTSQPTWEQAPEWQRDSAVAGVRTILSDPTLTPREQHENWMNRKIAEGWTYGKVKDGDLKEHPCLVPYSELPTEQRAKDFIFGAIVRSLAPYIEQPEAQPENASAR